jgi:hypothetical protein
VGRVSIAFPDWYLSLLNWRKKVPQFPLTQGGEVARTQQSLSPTMPFSSVGVSLDFLELRKAVARRHGIVNIVLDSIGLLCALGLVAAVGGMWALYSRFHKGCGFYYPNLSVATFLREDLQTIGECARKNYQRQREEALEDLRAASLLNRSREVVRKRLEDLLDVVEDESQQRCVQRSLVRGDLDNMKNVLSDVESKLGQKTPKERLTLLLESLREFCTAEDFEASRVEAFDTVSRMGFREARAVIVRRHDEFRTRAKSREDARIAGT